MQPITVLLGQLLLVLACIFAGMIAVTQWTAAARGYQAAFGAPLLRFR